jgi:diguanylate cyclase (GGDEF)-like protein/PAS domain S-box-containing protein
MHQAREQLLLRTAIEYVPDYFYVKDRELRLVAVNKKVAEHHHFDSPRHLVGKTDHDLVRARRADRLASRESGLLSNPSIPLHEVEKVIGDDGIERWFDTAKVALRGPDGEVVGLVGVTRDVTKAREVERDAEEGRDLFGLVLEEMPAGVALFDKDGVLRYSNARYRSTFPLTGHLRVPGANIRDILAGVVESGEQLGVGDDAARWIDDVTSALATTSDEEIALFDGTWMHLRTRPTGSGASLVVVSDVTSIKGPEKALLEMTDQLAKIATVDGMTGLLTRRAFDGRLRAAVRASEVNREAISLLMTDVDHFKLYNDTYGHLAGDVCLGRVAHALAAAVRDGDVVGRYGGEEFAAVLPKAGGQEAIEIAKRVLERLAEAAEPHSGSPLGYVTVSVGIASYEFDRSGRTPAELVKRADDALYQSKADGRARVTLWDSDPIDVEWSAT